MIYQIVFTENYFRYADEVSIDNEVLVTESSKIQAVKVKEISNFLMQGNTFLFD